jgi:hypothetical protein
MAMVCNKVVESAASGRGQEGGQWEALYRDNETFVEHGSAYFSQAFAEALGIVSDIELHDLERARLRLGAIMTLLYHAIQQYEAGLDADARTGLEAFHEDRLRKAGLDFEGAASTLKSGRLQGYIVADDDFIDRLSRIFSEEGYRALMDHYLRKVRNIHSLVSDAPTDAEVRAGTPMMWQEFTWRLLSAFTDAMGFGQSIAVMNAAAYR